MSWDNKNKKGEKPKLKFENTNKDEEVVKQEGAPPKSECILSY